MKLPITVDRTIDGDTIVGTIYLPLNISMRAQYFRLYGINAPEKTGSTKDAGYKAQSYLGVLLAEEPISATFHGKGKYGRWLVTLHDKNGRDINQMMVHAGEAVEAVTEINCYLWNMEAAVDPEVTSRVVKGDG